MTSAGTLNPPGGGGARVAAASVSASDRAQLAEHPVSLRRIVGLFHGERPRMAAVLAIIVISTVVGLANPFITRELIDHAIPDHDTAALLWLTGSMIAIVLTTQLLGVVQTLFSTTVGQNVMHRLRTRLFEHLQRLDLGFFTRTRGGEVQSRLTNDINAMQSVVSDAATSIATNVTTAIATSIAMVALSWRLSLLSLVILPPAVWMTRRVARMRRSVQAKAQRTLAEMQTQIEESLSVSGVALAKTLGSSGALSERFAESSRRLTRLEIAAQLSGRWMMATLAIFFAGIPAVIYLVAGLESTGGGTSIGTIVAFTGLQAALFRPILGVLSAGVTITTSLALFSRIFEYLDIPATVVDPAVPVRVDPDHSHGDVALHAVRYRYLGSHRTALGENVPLELSISAGSSVAIVGATGSGKSTLASLLSRLADPTEGSVTIDGVDLRAMRLENVADLVGVVSQENYLLHASIADNLRYARPDATDSELRAACATAQIDEMIDALPDGYATVVGSRGHRFSGGEQQRLALARTILRNPPILVLDEATSALDNQTERQLQKALDDASRGRTSITIAHRLSTIVDSDLIVVLDAGEIVERGTHSELVAAGGRYAELLAAQKDRGTLPG